MTATRAPAAGALLGALVAALLFAPPAGADVPARFWGVDPQVTPGTREFAQMSRGGIDSVRYRMDWNALEPSSGDFVWNDFDAVVEGTARTGMEALPVVLNTPGWLTDDGRILPVWTADQRRAWMDFLRAAVRRYGPDGEFWRSHSSRSPQPIPYRPIRTWQIWNEANNHYFSQPVAPRRYADLLKISHQAVVEEDPGAKIVIGGLWPNPGKEYDREYRAAEFLERLYRVPETKEAFDAVALHPYAKNASGMEEHIREVRAVMRRHGDARTGLWITEIGWGSGTGTAFEKGSLEAQKRELNRAFSILLENRLRWRISRVYWFAWRDRAGDCLFCDSVGLFTEDGVPKPAWFEFVRFAGGTP